MTKKLKKKSFFSVITKNFNWVTLTKNLVTFERWDSVKDQMSYRRDWLKRGRLGQFAHLRGGYAKKRGVVFLREVVDTPTHTMLVLVLKLQFEKNSQIRISIF